MRIGFLVWNTFQVGHFAELMHQFDEPDVIFINRDVSGLKDFDPQWLTRYGAYSRFIRETDLASLDGEYDAILAQFTPPLSTRWKKTKLVMCQYSMAKPKTAYNARWLASDLGLVYGGFSDKIIGKMCPTVLCGNPRFDPLFEKRLDSEILSRFRARLDPSKKTILFLPTWGDLSSQEKFKTSLSSLLPSFNVVYKPHHMTPLRDAANAASLGDGAIDATRITEALDSGPYLMELADVVVSDMSGAIFDSLYCRKPLVLLSLGRDLEAHAKADPSALEIAHTSRIGPLVLEPEDLHDAVELMSNDGHPYIEANEELVRESFVQRGGCAAIAAAGIRSFITSEPQHHDLQAYVAPNVRTAILCKAHDAAVKRLSKDSKKHPIRKAVKSSRSPRKFSPATKILNRLPAPLLMAFAKISHYVGMQRAENYLYYRARDAGNREAITTWQVEKSTASGTGTEKFNIKTALPKGAAARQELLRSLQDKEEFFDLGLCIEDWAASRPDLARKALYQFYCAAANLRFSRTKNRTLHNALVTFANDPKTGTTQVRRAILRDLGYLSEAIALGNAETDEAQTKLTSAANLLAPLTKYLDIAAGNEAVGLSDQKTITPKGEWLPVCEVKEPVFEMSLMLGFARMVGDENDGAREAMLTVTQNAVDALRRKGWAILPRIQAGHRGGVPISSKFPSATWHTTHSGVDGQIHLKVGPLNSHIIIDDRGYSGWSSLAHKPLGEITSNVTLDEAEAQYANLFETLVATGRSKYKQQTESVPDVGKYIFYPMQVMTDTVARLAHINGLRLLQILAEWGETAGYKIIVKRHPKCTVKAVKLAIEREQKNNRIVVSNASIHELISGAEAVVTVNSGVGAEALIHLKPVITAGDSDYAAATTLTRNEAELAEALQRIGSPLISFDDIKKFLWAFTKSRIRKGLSNRNTLQCGGS